MSLESQVNPNLGENVSTRPLRKKNKDGKLYTRVPEIESQLLELLSLSREVLVERCKVQRRDDPVYVRSECLLYFVRSCRAERSSTYFEKLYKIIAERVHRNLRNALQDWGRTESLTKSSIREQTFDWFVEFLMKDRTDYLEKLDIYEVRFDSALKKLLIDAQRKVYSKQNPLTRLESEERSSEVSAEVEQAAGSFDPLKKSKIIDNNYRSRLDTAIDSLPQEQKRIIEMLLHDFPIDSKDPEKVTIAGTLGKSEKTIRYHRDIAYAALRVSLTKGEKYYDTI